MGNATLTIENGDIVQTGIEFPSYLLDFTESVKDFIEMKEVLTRVFLEYYQTDDFKERAMTSDVRMLHYSLDNLLDSLHLANVEQKARVSSRELENITGKSMEELIKEYKATTNTQN
jgi:hypothetical protein